MSIDDYTLSGGIDSRAEEILSTGLNATPESIQGLITELKNRKYRSDLEYLLGCQMIESLEQRLNFQETSEVIMGYQEDLRNAISALQSRLDDLDAEGQSDLNEIQSALNTLQTTVNNLSTTVQGKASTTEVNGALDLKADKTDIKDPTWGEIGGNLADQTDLGNAFATKANTADVETAFAQLMPVINGKATAKPWDDIEIPVSGWSASKPYTQTVTVNGMLATYTPVADIIFADDADDTAIEAEESYYSCVKRITTGANSITLVCTSEKPAGTFHIHLKEVS